MRKWYLYLPLLLSGYAAQAQQNVGIGTTTPTLPLHVSRQTDTALLLLENRTALGVNTNAGMLFKNGGYYTGALRTIGTGPAFSRMSLFTYANGNPNSLRERLSIMDDGKVGIGTTTPVASLQIAAPTDSMSLLMEKQSDLAAGSSIGMYLKNGTYYTGAVKTVGAGTSVARLGFYTYASTATTGLKERLSIRDDGNVGINSTNPSAQLEVVGTSKFSQGTATAAVEINGAIKVSGNYKPAFVLVCNGDNLTDAFVPVINYNPNNTYYTSVIIDNPLCNFDPNAIIMVTPQEMPIAFAVVYDNNLSKWKIQINRNSVKNDGCFGSGSPSGGCGPYSKAFLDYQPVGLAVGQKFNVMVFKQ